MTFGNQLRLLRQQNGFTQEGFAKKMNLSKSNISKYEAGSVEPNFTTLSKIADMFNVSVDYLLGRSSASVFSSSDIVPAEQHLIDLYRNLNSEGQAKLTDYADDLNESGKYIKSNSIQKEA